MYLGVYLRVYHSGCVPKGVPRVYHGGCIPPCIYQVVPWWVYTFLYMPVLYHPGYTMVYTPHPAVYRVPHSVYSVYSGEALGSVRRKPLGERETLRKETFSS